MTTNTNMQANLPDEILRALANAKRSPGWNNRRGDVKRFELGRCTLYVVPFRCWAYRRTGFRARRMAPPISIPYFCARMMRTGSKAFAPDIHPIPPTPTSAP
jgi:hypothetical protein